MTRDDDIFSRWSARKRAVRVEEERQRPAPAPAEAPEPEEPEEETAGEAEEETLARLGLPDPDTLTEGDDFAAFMKAGVPEALRRRALRRLWRSNPVLANLDGLNDYDEDFRAPELTQKVLATAYKVGRGFLKDDDPPAEEAAAGDDVAEAGRSESAETNDERDGEESPPETEPTVAEAGEDAGEEAGDNSSDTPGTPRPRRMVFRG